MSVQATSNMTGRATTDGIIRLADGRSLGYLDTGERDAPPVFYFHGIPGCRLDGWGGDGCAAEAGVRLIAVDRPGFGLSDPCPGRRLLDWPDDVEQLADALGVERFAVVGYSAGGPYALACGLRLRERVNRVGLIAGLGPLAAPRALRGLGPAMFYRLARRRPEVMSGLFRLWGWSARRRPGLATRVVVLGTARSDREVLGRPEVRRRYLALTAEATRQGGQGATDDMRVVLDPWGFDPADVNVPVMIWHGDADIIVTEAMVETYAGAIGTSTITRYEDEGHLGLENHMPEILHALVQ